MHVLRCIVMIIIQNNVHEHWQHTPNITKKGYQQNVFKKMFPAPAHQGHDVTDVRPTLACIAVERTSQVLIYEEYDYMGINEKIFASL